MSEALPFSPGDLVTPRVPLGAGGASAGDVGLVLEVTGPAPGRALVVWSKNFSDWWCASADLRRVEDGDE